MSEWRTKAEKRHSPGPHSGPRRSRPYAAAAVVAVLFALPAALVAAPLAHADPGVPGINEFAQCVRGAGVAPRPSADDWWPVIKQIEWNLNNGEPAAEVSQRLAATGIAPNDAAAEVRCTMATVW